jgi:hypothetical protein
MIDETLSNIQKMRACLHKAEKYEQAFYKLLAEMRGRARADAKYHPRPLQSDPSFVAKYMTRNDPELKELADQNKWYIQQSIMYGINALVDWFVGDTK